MKRILFLVILFSIWGQIGKLKAFSPNRTIVSMTEKSSTGEVTTTMMISSKTQDSIISEKYEAPKDYPKDLVVSKSGDKYGFVDKGGKLVIPYLYDEVMWYSDGLAAVAIDGKWGLVDSDNIVAVFWQYDMVSSTGFTEGLLAVCLNGKWGFIDRTGREIIPIQYDAVEPFSQGLARAVCYKSLKNRLGEYLEQFQGYIDKRNNRYLTKLKGLVALEKDSELKEIPDYNPCSEWQIRLMYKENRE